MRLSLVRREVVADGVVVLDLRDPSGSDLPSWTPGAHIDVVPAAGVVRQYSLCGDPADRTVWRIAVLREPDGRGGSRALHDKLAEGDLVEVRGPRNHFPLVPAPPSAVPPVPPLAVRPPLPELASPPLPGLPPDAGAIDPPLPLGPVPPDEVL